MVSFVIQVSTPHTCSSMWPAQLLTYELILPQALAKNVSSHFPRGWFVPGGSCRFIPKDTLVHVPEAQLLTPDNRQLPLLCSKTVCARHFQSHEWSRLDSRLMTSNPHLLQESPSSTRDRNNTMRAVILPTTERPSGFLAIQPPRTCIRGLKSSISFAPTLSAKTTATSLTAHIPSTPTATLLPCARDPWASKLWESTPMSELHPPPLSLCLHRRRVLVQTNKLPTSSLAIASPPTREAA